MNWLEDYDATYSHGQEGVEIRFEGFRIKTENEFDLSCLWPKNKRISNYRPIKVIARHCNKRLSAINGSNAELVRNAIENNTMFTNPLSELQIYTHDSELKSRVFPSAKIHMMIKEAKIHLTPGACPSANVARYIIGITLSLQDISTLYQLGVKNNWDIKLGNPPGQLTDVFWKDLIVGQVWVIITVNE